jgi:hypothetical protein
VIVKPGSVYRDGDIDFIVAIERINGDRFTVNVRLINATNWIILSGYPGKVLANGNIDVADLTGELVAQSLSDYFRKPRKTAQ